MIKPSDKAWLNVRKNKEFNLHFVLLVVYKLTAIKNSENAFIAQLSVKRRRQKRKTTWWWSAVNSIAPSGAHGAWRSLLTAVAGEGQAQNTGCSKGGMRKLKQSLVNMK